MKTLGAMLGLKPKIIAIFGLYTVTNNVLRTGVQHWDLTGAEATVEVGAQHKGVTAGRVLALGVLALAVKKDKTQVYVTINLADNKSVIIDGPAAKEKQARLFAATVNRVSGMTFS
jgi:glycine cleavage system aminomethyltransferase T